MVHGITKYQRRKMNNGSIRYYSIAILLFTVLLSSCIKETAIPSSSFFSIEVSEDKTSPMVVQLKNESYGADEYEWTFEGGEPSSSTGTTRPRDDQGAALTEYGASDVLFEEAAEGFCSWFILQYMRGYKPFVTMMSKEIIIQGQLN